MSHLTQLVQLDVGLQFSEANLRLWGKGGTLKQAEAGHWESGIGGRQKDAYQANTAEAPAKRLVKDGAIEGQLFKVALGQPDVSW